MTYSRPLIFILTFLCLSSSAWSQSLEIVSHYPTTAYMINRMLPFTITGDGTVSVLSVDMDDESCTGMPDRFHSQIFHIYCREPGIVTAQIIYMFNSTEKLSSTTSPITIVEVADPDNEPTPTVGPTSGNDTPTDSIFNNNGSLFGKPEGDQ